MYQLSFTITQTVTYGQFLSLRFSKPTGGQFSSFMPSGKTLEANASLISLSDLRQRFGFQKFRFGTLDQVANVVNVFRFQTVGGTNGQLQIINRAQQDRSICGARGSSTSTAVPLRSAKPTVDQPGYAQQNAPPLPARSRRWFRCR